MRKLAIAAGVAVAVGLGVVAPAVAQYGGEGPAVAIPDPGPSVLNSAIGAAGGCPPDTPVTVLLDGEVVATGTTNADGSFDIPFTTPDQPGEYVLEVVCS